MTTPPETAPPPTAPPTPPDRGMPLGLGMAPGNAEFVVWVVALVVAMLVTWVADDLGTPSWLDFFQWTGIAYLLSRGIAKASRVYEY
jgi:hypothetical protein